MLFEKVRRKELSWSDLYFFIIFSPKEQIKMTSAKANWITKLSKVPQFSFYSYLVTYVRESFMLFKKCRQKVARPKVQMTENLKLHVCQERMPILTQYSGVKDFLTISSPWEHQGFTPSNHSTWRVVMTEELQGDSEGSKKLIWISWQICVLLKFLFDQKM